LTVESIADTISSVSKNKVMKIVIELETGNAAFVDNYAELERVLVKAAKQITQKIDGQDVPNSVRDYNGNKVLAFEIQN
jgi:hypothetical protein